MRDRWWCGLGTLIFLVGCGLGVAAVAPDEVAPSGPRIWFDGQPHVAGVVDQVERVHAAALAVCPSSRREQLEEAWSAAEVHWRPDPFDCDGAKRVRGCEVGSLVYVATSAVIPDELGHLAWTSCFDRPGDHWRWIDVYDEDFKAWLATAQ